MREGWRVLRPRSEDCGRRKTHRRCERALLRERLWYHSRPLFFSLERQTCGRYITSLFIRKVKGDMIFIKQVLRGGTHLLGSHW